MQQEADKNIIGLIINQEIMNDQRDLWYHGKHQSNW